MAILYCTVCYESGLDTSKRYPVKYRQESGDKVYIIVNGETVCIKENFINSYFYK